MVIEESSVVAASAKAAKFWLERGGFKAEVVSTTKVGQVHFIWNGNSEQLFNFFEESKKEILESISPLVVNMNKRGGGLLSLEMKDCSDLEEGYYQLHGEFETCDAMGANFINSVLEAVGKKWQELVMTNLKFEQAQRDIQIVMCILSNYTPNCLVKAWVECDVSELEDAGLGMSAEDFAHKFSRAVRIASATGFASRRRATRINSAAVTFSLDFGLSERLVIRELSPLSFKLSSCSAATLYPVRSLTSSSAST